MTDKLKTVPDNLSKLSNAVKNDVVKKTLYNELIKNVNAIQSNDTSDLVKMPTKTRKLKILKRKFLIMINILLLMNSTS